MFSVGTSLLGSQPSDTDDDIVFAVAITVLEHDTIPTDPYDIGFTIWRENMDGLEIMWSTYESVTVNADPLPELVRSLQIVTYITAPSLNR